MCSAPARTRTSGTYLISSVMLKRVDGTTVEDIKSKLVDTGMTVVSDTMYHYIVYPARLPISVTMDEGQYYLQLTDSIGTVYSEVFTVVNDISNCIKIEWWDDQDFVFDGGKIIYTNPLFYNRVYLPTEIGMPDYTFNEEGEERDGFFFPQKQLSEKTYRCTFLAPEYLCDVMRMIRMADHVVVTDRHGRQYVCDTFLMTPKWQPQGYLASVDVEFQTSTVMKKVGYSRYDLNLGDYNIDYNDDYDITNND